MAAPSITLMSLTKPNRLTPSWSIDRNFWTLDSFSRTRNTRIVKKPTIRNAYVRPIGRDPSTINLGLSYAPAAAKAFRGSEPRRDHWIQPLIDLDSLLNEILVLEFGKIGYGQWVLDSAKDDYQNFYVLPSTVNRAPANIPNPLIGFFVPPATVVSDDAIAPRIIKVALSFTAVEEFISTKPRFVRSVE